MNAKRIGLLTFFLVAVGVVAQAISNNEWFVKAFEDAWREPATRFVKLFHPDGTLLQPGMERPIGREKIPEQVARILARWPDFQVETKHWAVSGDVVFIEWTASGKFHGEGERVQWQGASRFTLRDGLIIEEIAYSDTWPLRVLENPGLRQMQPQ